MTVTNFPYGINTPFTTTAITAAETAAGVTPTDYSYPPGNVMRYGAITDGTRTGTAPNENNEGTDNTTAIQNAINVQDANVGGGGGQVFIPPGNFLVTSLTVPTSVQLMGIQQQGWQGGSTLLQSQSAVDHLITMTPSGTPPAGDYQHWSLVKNLFLYGDSRVVGPVDGINVDVYDMGEGFTIDRVSVVAFSGNGIHANQSGATAATLNDLHLFRNAVNGLYIEGGGTAGWQGLWISKISGDNNVTSLIKIKTSLTNGENWTIRDIKAETTNGADQQNTIILEDVAGPIKIENLSQRVNGGSATLNSVVQLAGTNNACLVLENISTGSNGGATPATYWIDDVKNTLTLAASEGFGSGIHYLVWNGGEVFKLDKNGTYILDAGPVAWGANDTGGVGKKALVVDN